MDHKTYNRFINSVINRFKQSNELNDIDKNEIITSLNKLRNNPEKIDVYYDNKNLDYTSKYLNTPTLCWFPGCILIGILLIPYFIIIFIVIGIDLWMNCHFSCDLGTGK